MSRRPPSYEVHEYLSVAEAVHCPVCNAPPLTPCTNPLTGDLMRVSHWQRFRDASKPTTPTEGTHA